MKRRFMVLGLLVCSAVAGWGWHACGPNARLGRMLDLPGSMRVRHSSIESSRLFLYATAYGDVECSEKDFRGWQARIRGVAVRYEMVPFPTQNMPDSVKKWWIGGLRPGELVFQARRGGVSVNAVWREGRAYAIFYQRGKWGESWEGGAAEAEPEANPPAVPLARDGPA